MRWVGVVARTLYVAAAVAATISWRCPALDTRPAAACECDVPRTLRCAGDHTALQIIGAHLKKLNQQPNTASAISLLDLTLRGVAVLTASGAAELAGAHLRGLVVSSGELRRVQRGAFAPLANTLQALGLPNNQLTSVPTESLVPLYRLDRLDLSNNRIKILEAESFMGFNNISFLDLSDNQLITISSESVGALKRLRVLRVRGNQLTIPTLSSLKEVKSLRELDLSANKLTGPLGPSTMPSLKSLVSLQLADNSFKSVRRGALAGLTNLTYLGLHNNQIDVLEDYAFRQLANLTELDLSHNEIVTVSGNSLSHLSKLVKLDMSHNFLRSLSAEPLRSLKSLRELQLHDNDVSMVDDEALLDHHQLTRLTMTDNPLNCDCLLSGFARWLREAKMLPSTDVKDAVCATPPHLEGALLVHLSKQTLCDDHDSAIHRQPGGTPDVFLDADKAIDYSYADPVDNSSRVVSQEEDDMDEYGQEEVDYGDSSPELPFPLDNSLPISQSKVILTHHTFDGRSLRLWWSGAAGRCDALFAYARAGTRERLAAARRVRCERTARGLRASLTVDDSLVIGNSYRFCIALLESTVGSGDLSLALGCSEMFPLAITEPVAPFVPVVPIAVRESNIRVSGVISNVTSEGILSIEVLLSGFPPIRSQDLLLQPPNAEYLQAIHRCFILITVLAGNILVVQREVPCSKPTISMEGFLQGPYQICAKLAEIPERKLNSKCSTAEMQHTILSSGVMKTTYKGINLALVGVSFGLLTIVLALVWATRKLLKKPAEFDQGHQCFRPEAPVVEDGQHSRYLKLQATSNV